MAKRSLQASTQGIQLARKAFSRKGWTQEQLAYEVGLKTRQAIGRFFACQPVDRRVFTEICFQLDIEWEDIADLPKDDDPPDLSTEDQETSIINIDVLVAEVRSLCQENIHNQCGILRLLDVARPIELNDLYVHVNILEEISSHKWIDIAELRQNFNPEQDNFERFGLGLILQRGVPALNALEKFSKLKVLGKPGAGKTTFLQYIAIECIQGRFAPDYLPIFILLKDFAEDSADTGDFNLVNYISEKFNNAGVTLAQIETLLHESRCLILLDGLDEVPSATIEEVIKQIRKISEKYPKNKFLVTCRIAAQEYRFAGFTEVEVADFNLEQITYFAQKWFVAVAGYSEAEGIVRANQFMEKLMRPENQQIRELAVTPLLLNLTCLVFQAKSDFPSQRAKIYEEGLDILLVKWDKTRGIDRDDYYRDLSRSEKLELLSYLAATTYATGEYFFEQSKIQKILAEYISTKNNNNNSETSWQIDGESVLKAIEAQHGLLVERARRIYSFSHLTFQEYFTAKYWTNGEKIESLEKLVNYVSEKRWREVFLLATEMLRKNDKLLLMMKEKIDDIVAGEEKIQQFLAWIDEKAKAANIQAKPAAVRAFYFSLGRAIDHHFSSGFLLGSATFPFPNFAYFPLPLYLSLANAIDYDFIFNKPIVNLDFNRNYTLKLPDLILEKALNRIDILEQTLKLALSFQIAIDKEQALELQQDLQTIKSQLPDLKNTSLDIINNWWQNHGSNWVEQLKNLIKKHSDQPHHWYFSQEQKILMKHYYEANRLIVACLSTDCEIDPLVRHQIELTLLLPKVTIDQTIEELQQFNQNDTDLF